jgi:predicted N-acetyltransferase YhbS
LLSDIPYFTLHVCIPDIMLGMVTPAGQRMGIGAAVLSSFLAAARQANMPIYIEATRAGEPLYRRLGFREVGRLQIEGIEAYATCMLWEDEITSKPSPEGARL